MNEEMITLYGVLLGTEIKDLNDSLATIIKAQEGLVGVTPVYPYSILLFENRLQAKVAIKNFKKNKLKVNSHIRKFDVEADKIKKVKKETETE